MKSNKMVSFLILFVTVISACEKDFENMNTNPNALSDMDPEYLFSNAVKKTFRDLQWERKLQLYFGSQYSHFYIVPHNTARPHDMYKGHFFTDDFFNIMSESFTGPIKLIQETIRLTSEGETKNDLRKGVADVVAICNFMKMTDLFGDIPYTEGGYGQTGNLLPEYDPQSYIYEDMIEKLGASIQVMKTGDATDAFPGFDPLFNNDLEKWIGFANSLRLRLAMHIRFANSTLANAVIQECMEEALIDSNEDNAQIITYDDPDLYNQWYSHFQITPWKMSQKLVDWLKFTSDPRLYSWVEPNIYGEYIGGENGLNEIVWSQMPWDSISDPTPALYARDMPVYFLCAAETRFYAAEATLMGLNPGGDANVLYQEGIRLAMEQWNVEPDSINDFINNVPEATLSGDLETALEQIGTQLWLSLATNFIESYTSIRRLGYPIIPKRTDPWLDKGETDGVLPRRFLYPYDEVATNSANVQEAIDRQGPNELTTPVWWDVRDN